MRIGSSLGTTLGVFLCAMAPAFAAPLVTETITYYQVDGSTIMDIRNAMTAKGPQSYWGYTQWYVAWSADCEVTVKITYTYPDWSGYDDADEDLREYWDKFISNLEIHEHGHGEHGRRAGAGIEAADCAEDPYGIIEKWGKQDVIYDDETNHGETQGAVF